jgi:molybdate transport system ATP-binding protein
VASSSQPDIALHVRLRQMSPIPLDVSFDVAPGRVMALVGPSGSGKSTTLRAIAGLHRPLDGSVVCNGRTWLETASGTAVPARRRRVGLVFQSYALFPHLSAIENVMESLTDRPRSVRRSEALHYLAKVHLTDLGHRRPGELSGGQQQRVAVARALARRPDVMLLDEPFSAVDRATRFRLQAELAELRRDLSMPVVLVTHDLDEATRLADEVVVLSEGRVLASGPIEEVFARLDLGVAVGPHELGAILSVTVKAHEPEFALTLLALGKGTLVVPAIGRDVGTAIRIQISARDVTLALKEPTEISIRNILPSEVVDVTFEDGAYAEVLLVASGQHLRSRITRKSAVELDLRPGRKVFALIKSIAVEADRPRRT